MGCASILHGRTTGTTSRPRSTAFAPPATAICSKTVELRTCAPVSCCSSEPCHVHTIYRPRRSSRWARRPCRPYSQAVKAGGLIYISGTLAQDAAGRDHRRRATSKARRRAVIERMRELLTAAGIVARAGRRRHRLFEVGERLRGDERGLQRVLDEGPADADDGRHRPRRCPTRSSRSRWSPCRTGAERVVIHPPSWIKSPNPYSYAIRTGDTVFLSGLVSRNGRDNSVVDGRHQRANGGRPRQCERSS